MIDTGANFFVVTKRILKHVKLNTHPTTKLGILVANGPKKKDCKTIHNVYVCIGQLGFVTNVVVTNAYDGLLGKKVFKFFNAKLDPSHLYLYESKDT